MANIHFIPGQTIPLDMQPDDLYSTTVYFCRGFACTGFTFQGTWQEVNDFWYQNVVQGDGYTSMQACQTYCAANPCDSMNIVISSIVGESSTGSNDGSLTFSLSWVYTQTVPTLTNVPINLYDSAGNILDTVFMSPPDVHTFSGLSGGAYSIGPSLSFAYEANGSPVEVTSCDVNVSAIVADPPEKIFGCTDETACNFNPLATFLDESCIYADCSGVCNGTAYIDECGNCVGGESGKLPCEQDCFGVYGGSAIIDDCGECNNPLNEAFNTSCLDCRGILNGPNMIDGCGACNDPRAPLEWNVKCVGCKDSCAINYDSDAIYECEACCMNVGVTINCPCSDTAATPSINVFAVYPVGAIITPAGTVDGVFGSITIGSGATFTYNSVLQTQVQTVIPIGVGNLLFTEGELTISDGRVTGSATIALGEPGSAIKDGFYTITIDSISSSYSGKELFPAQSVTVCTLFMCNIEKCLQKHMKRIMLEPQCCDCSEMKELFIKAFTLYRAVKIAEKCAIKGDVERALLRLKEYCSRLSSQKCTNC